MVYISACQLTDRLRDCHKISSTLSGNIFQTIYFQIKLDFCKSKVHENSHNHGHYRLKNDIFLRQVGTWILTCKQKFFLRFNILRSIFCWKLDIFFIYGILQQCSLTEEIFDNLRSMK